MAPEILLGHYGPECDVWSCGILMYVLLSGTLPFGGDNNPEIFHNILNNKFSFEGEVWKRTSLQAKDLINKL